MSFYGPSFEFTIMQSLACEDFFPDCHGLDRKVTPLFCWSCSEVIPRFEYHWPAVYRVPLVAWGGFSFAFPRFFSLLDCCSFPSCLSPSSLIEGTFSSSYCQGSILPIPGTKLADFFHFLRQHAKQEPFPTSEH